MLIHLLIFLTCETEVCIPIKSNFPVSHSAIFSNTITLNHQIIYVATKKGQQVPFTEVLTSELEQVA